MGEHHETLKQAIEVARDALLAKGLSDAVTINEGHGSCIVSHVAEILGGLHAFHAMGMREIGIDRLMKTDPEDMYARNGFDLDLIARDWPAIQPPRGLTWEDLDAVSFVACFDTDTHEWIVYGGRHYDAEAPEGVDNPFELPFFRRIIEEWTDRGVSVPAGMR